MLKHPILLTISAGFALLLLSSCGELAGSGQPITIPIVTIACTATNCSGGPAAPTVHLIITGSDCATQAAFGAVAAGAFTGTCNGAGCSGTNNTGWEINGSTITQISSGTYNVCGVIDYSGQFDATTGIPHSGDAAVSLNNVFIDANTTALTLSNWANVP